MVKTSKLERLITDYIRQANHNWSLFTTDDILLVAVSGGKDSLALFYLLEKMKINVQAVHVCLSKQSKTDFIIHNNLEDKINVIETNILKEVSNDKNPCFSCSKKRRKALVEYADKKTLKKLQWLIIEMM